MPIKTTITNLSNKPIYFSWIPPHGRKLDAAATYEVPGDVIDYHLFPTPNYRAIQAILRATQGESPVASVVTENV